MTCCICNREMEEHECNNAEPYMSGYCCPECNSNYVIPARIQAYEMQYN